MVSRASAKVVIAGGGPAAAASAVALRLSGINVLMLLSPRPVFRMAEAIRGTALPLLEALGLRDVASAVGLPVRGLESRLDDGNPSQRRDMFVLVDRADFAKRMLDAAVLHGAATEVVHRVPALIGGDRSVRLATSKGVREFQAAIDATGRAALWSRPLKRRPTRLAHVFQSPPMSTPQGLKLMRYESGWAYRIGLGSYMTSVLISKSARSPELPEALARAFGTSSRESTMIGRRVARVQWAASPIQHRTIAVGDAALAHDPISGQGIRFALASALAAASVIRSWRGSPNDEAVASSFYSEFVATERNRHLSFLDSFYETSSQVVNERTKISAAPIEGQPAAHHKVFFSGRIENAPLHIDGFIKLGHAIRLSDGGSVRWVSGFDLLRLHSLTTPAVTVSCLTRSLSAEGLERHRAVALINWCVRNEILKLDRPNL